MMNGWQEGWQICMTLEERVEEGGRNEEYEGGKREGEREREERGKYNKGREIGRGSAEPEQFATSLILETT